MHIRSVSQQVEMMIHHVLVIADSGSRLRLVGRKGVNLAGCLVDERKHHVEGDIVRLQDTGTQVVHVVDKVTGKDGTQVEIAPALTIEMIDLLAKCASQQLHQAHVRLAFEENGNLAEILKESGCTQCDETTLLVIRDGRKAGRKSYLWIHVTSELGNEHPITVICYEPDRSTRHLREFFEGYAGEIVCDAYSAYQTFETENGETVIICGCWMHSRRRWAEALRVRNVSGLSLRQIEELPPGISARMKDAIQYSLNQKEYLCRFLTDGNLPLDNGACERSIRALAVGRANWLFATSPKGAESAAIMYSLVETAKMNGANVYYYLKYLLENAPFSPQLKVSEKYLDTLMPWSEEYRKYETAEKKKVFENCIPPSQPDPVRRKLKKTIAA